MSQQFAALFSSPETLGVIVLRTFVVYVALLLGLRVTGKREIGQMTTFDLVTILVISNAVQNAMVGSDTSLEGGLAAALLLLLLNYGVSQMTMRSRRLEDVLQGTPTLLIHNGAFVEEHLRHEHISEDDVMMAIREHGFESVEQVKTAVMEVDGSISIIAMDAKSVRTRKHFRFLKQKG